MNALIVINLHGKLDAMELMRPFFYPLEAENRLLWVKKQSMAEIDSMAEIGEDVLSWLRKYQITDFNIVVLTGLPLKTPSDTITNQLYRLQRHCIDTLKQEQLIPENYYVITLDGLRRDGINGRPQDQEHIKAWEIDKQGSVNEENNDDFLFNKGHLQRLNEQWKAPFDLANETIDQGLQALTSEKQKQVRQSLLAVSTVFDEIIKKQFELIKTSYVDTEEKILNLFEEKYRIIQTSFHQQLKGLEGHIGHLNYYSPGTELNNLLKTHLGLACHCDKATLIYLSWQTIHGQIPVDKLMSLTQLILLISQQKYQKEGLGRCEHNGFYYRAKIEIKEPVWQAVFNNWYSSLQYYLKVLNSQSPTQSKIDYFPLDNCNATALTALTSLEKKSWSAPERKGQHDEQDWQKWLSDKNMEVQQRQMTVQTNIEKLAHQLNASKTIEKKQVNDIVFELQQAKQDFQSCRHSLKMDSEIVTPKSYLERVRIQDKLLKIRLKMRPSDRMVAFWLFCGVLILASAYGAGITRLITISPGLPQILPLLSLCLVGFFVLLPIGIIRKHVNTVALRCHTMALEVAETWSEFQKIHVDRLKALCRLNLAKQNLLNIEQLDQALEKQAKLNNYHRHLLQKHSDMVEEIAQKLNIPLDTSIQKSTYSAPFINDIPPRRNPAYWPVLETSTSVTVNIGNTSDLLNIMWTGGVTFDLIKTELAEFGRE